MTHPGPSHPSPSGPSQPSTPSRGHLPIGAGGICTGKTLADGAPAACGTVVPYRQHRADFGWSYTPVRPAPRLGEVVRDVERLLAQADTILDRGHDPASATPGAGLYLGEAQARIRDVVDLLHGAVRYAESVGSAVPVAVGAGYGATQTPAHRDPAVATTGGPAGESRARSGEPGTAELIGARS